VIYPDGSCVDCELLAPRYSTSETVGEASFTNNPTLFTGVPASVFPSALSRGVYEFGIDGLVRSGQALVSGAVSDPVWSSRGELAVVRGGWIWVGSPHGLHRLARGELGVEHPLSRDYRRRLAAALY
jgi:hypothetical protein